MSIDKHKELLAQIEPLMLDIKQKIHVYRGICDSEYDHEDCMRLVNALARLEVVWESLSGKEYLDLNPIDDGRPWRRHTEWN